MIAEIKIPRISRDGGSFAAVASLLQRLECKRSLIVTDPWMMKNQLAERLARQMRDAGLSCEVFHETVPDPTSAVVEAGARVFVQGGHDSLGGEAVALSIQRRPSGCGQPTKGKFGTIEFRSRFQPLVRRIWRSRPLPARDRR